MLCGLLSKASTCSPPPLWDLHSLSMNPKGLCRWIPRAQRAVTLWDILVQSLFWIVSPPQFLVLIFVAIGCHGMFVIESIWFALAEILASKKFEKNIAKYFDIWILCRDIDNESESRWWRGGEGVFLLLLLMHAATKAEATSTNRVVIVIGLLLAAIRCRWLQHDHLQQS